MSGFYGDENNRTEILREKLESLKFKINLKSCCNVCVVVVCTFCLFACLFSLTGLSS